MKRRAPNRREFLSSSAAVAVAAGSCGWTARNATAIDAIVRNGTPKFKFSLAAYSYRKLLQGNPAELTLKDFIDDCASMGLEGTELTSYYFPDRPSKEYLRDLKRHCFRLGLDISGTAVGNDFGYPPGEQRDQQIASVKRWIERAEILGAPVIRIFAGKQKPGVSAERSHALMVEGMQECCEYAGQHGIHLALENHGGPTADPSNMLKLVHDVESPWFGVNLDSGNFHSDDPYGDLEQIAPFAVNAQIKVVTTDESRQNRQPSDFKRLAKILRDVGYRGYIVLEFEEDEDPRVACPRYAKELRQAFK